MLISLSSSYYLRLREITRQAAIDLFIGNEQSPELIMLCNGSGLESSSLQVRIISSSFCFFYCYIFIWFVSFVCFSFVYIRLDMMSCEFLLLFIPSSLCKCVYTWPCAYSLYFVCSPFFSSKMKCIVAKRNSISNNVLEPFMLLSAWNFLWLKIIFLWLVYLSSDWLYYCPLLFNDERYVTWTVYNW